MFVGSAESSRDVAVMFDLLRHLRYRRQLLVQTFQGEMHRSTRTFQVR